MVLLYIASALDVVHLSHMVNVVESNWNDILFEFRRLYQLMKGLSLS